MFLLLTYKKILPGKDKIFFCRPTAAILHLDGKCVCY